MVLGEARPGALNLETRRMLSGDLTNKNILTYIIVIKLYIYIIYIIIL